MVKYIYQNKYQNLNLESVSKAILGEGKFEEMDGRQAHRATKEKQMQYVAQDAVLVMKLSQYNNYEIFDLMNAISLITNVPFDKVCYNGISIWWDKIIRDKIRNNECRLPTTINATKEFLKSEKKKSYKGGIVLNPKIGYYYKDNQTVYVLDVKSLYPTIMINKNISFDTVNCSCCKVNTKAQVTQEIIDLIGDDDKNNKKQYWICKLYRGIIPRLLEQYRNERFRQQELGNDAMQIALKNLINTCYSVFGDDTFEFADYRVLN